MSTAVDAYIDVERKLISKTAHTGSVEDLISAGVEPNHFEDPECKAVWEGLVDHVKRYGGSPSFSTVKAKHPQFGFVVIADQLEFVRDQFFREVKRRLGLQALEAIARQMENRQDTNVIDNIDSIFLEQSRKLAQAVPSPSVSRYSEMVKRIELYKQMKKLGKLPGIPFGIQVIDDLTLGIQPHEYITIAGWQGKGKSTLAQFICFQAYSLGDATPMYISLEMESAALFRKWDVMSTNFEYAKLKSLTLDPDEEKLWAEAAVKAKARKNDIIVLDDVGRCTVDKVYAEMVRYKPSLCVVDYITLMETRRSANSMWETVTNLTKELKQIARTLKIPIIGLAQTNIDSADSGAALSNIAYSRSIGQDSDLVFGLHQDEEMAKKHQMQVSMLKNRDGITRNVEMLWIPEQMRFREWNSSDEFSSFKPGIKEGSTP